MNILFNLGNISRESGGVYQYSIMLLKTLEKQAANHDFYIYHDSIDENIENIINNGGFKKFILVKDFSFTIHVLFYRLANFLIKLFNIKTKPFFVDALTYTIKKKKIEIVHSTFQSIIKVDKVKTITTMHDLQELYFPEYFSSTERAARAVGYKEAIDKSDIVVVSFEHVKKDVVRFFAKPQEKIQVILLDMEDLWIDQFSKNDVKNISSVEHFQEFVLYPAATWEHKNHIKLIETIAYLKDNKSLYINLVCTGHLTNYYEEKLKPIIAKHSLEKQVIFLGVVPDIDLFSLYHHCKAVVIPTIYEAGSFPLIEAILLNIPVICSNVTSLPNTIGDQVFTFEPNDIDDMADKIIKILKDSGFIAKNIENSTKQKARLRNSNAEQKILNIYEQILK